MKKIFMLLLIVMFPVFLMAQKEDAGSGIKYVGVEKCKICHKKADDGNQFGIWEKSKHSKAYEILKGPEAAKIAKEKGLKTAANEAPECLKCHVTGHNDAKSVFDKKFKVEDGVQCESCHGAGDKYRKKKIMEDRKVAIKNGLEAILVKDGTAEKKCKTCHNSESPTFKSFDFKESWKQIAHPIPQKK